MPACVDLTHRFPNAANLETHTDAVIAPQGVERALIGLLNGVAEYCQSHLRRHGQPVGLDGEKACYVLDLLATIRTLLRFGAGRLDIGTVEAAIVRIAEKHKIALNA